MSKCGLDYRDTLNYNVKCDCWHPSCACSQIPLPPRQCTCVCPWIWSGQRGPTGAQGPAGPQGDTGPAGPQGPTQVLGIQAELLNQAGVELASGAPIIFDNILNQVGSAISYNIATGEFTLMRNGTYLVNWWVSVDGTDSTVGVILSLNMDGGTYSRSAAPPVTGQIAGSALVAVVAGPAVLSLTNISGDSITFEDISLQASIVIAGIPV